MPKIFLYSFFFLFFSLVLMVIWVKGFTSWWILILISRTIYFLQKKINKASLICRRSLSVNWCSFSPLKSTKSISSTAKVVTRLTNAFLCCLQQIRFFPARQSSWMITFLGPQHCMERVNVCLAAVVVAVNHLGDSGLSWASPTPAVGASPTRPYSCQAGAASLGPPGLHTPSRGVPLPPHPAGRAGRWASLSAPPWFAIFQGSGGGLYGSGWGLLCQLGAAVPPPLPSALRCTPPSVSHAWPGSRALLFLWGPGWWIHRLGCLPAGACRPPRPACPPPRYRGHRSVHAGTHTRVRDLPLSSCLQCAIVPVSALSHGALPPRPPAHPPAIGCPLRSPPCSTEERPPPAISPPPSLQCALPRRSCRQPRLLPTSCAAPARLRIRPPQLRLSTRPPPLNRPWR